MSIVIFHKEYSVIAPVDFLICVSIPLTFAGYFGVKKDIRCGYESTAAGKKSAYNATVSSIDGVISGAISLRG